MLYQDRLTSSRHRPKYLEQYKDVILGWLTEHSDMSSAQVHDWLKEKHETYTGKERTVRHYVGNLRKKHNIPKKRSCKTGIRQLGIHHWESRPRLTLERRWSVKLTAQPHQLYFPKA